MRGVILPHEEVHATKRRSVLQLAAMLSLPRWARAQPTAKAYRIGVLLSGTRERFAATLPRVLQSFLEGLRERGYVEGRNLTVEWRGADGKLERFPELVAELVSLGVDLIVAATASGAVAARKVSGKVPIVFVQVGDPVALGLVDSLARPGGNATGLTTFADAIVGKQLDLLKSIVPGLRSVAVIYSSKEVAAAQPLAESRETAKALKLELRMHDVASEADLESAFRAIAQARPDGMQVFWTSFTYIHLKRIVQFATEQRLPAVYGVDGFADAGGLVSYSVNNAEHWRRIADYVDRILRGAKPADLPVQRPTTLELVVNLKTARAIGVTIPQSVLVRADRVIE